MYVVIKKEGEKEKVINLLYGDDDTFVRKWVITYLNEEIESLTQCPSPKNYKDIVYEIHSNVDEFLLIRKYTKVSSGFIYNSVEKGMEEMFSMRYLEYDNTNDILDTNTTSLNWNLNTEINNRVLKQLDKQSLYQVMMKIQYALGTKKTWNKEEYTNVVCEVIKNFKKELYSSIAKKMKRFGKRKTLFTYNSCKLEAHIKNKND